MKFLRQLVPFVLLILGVAEVASASPVGQNFLVIVNAKNPATVLTRDQAARLFLKKEPRFADGTKAEPVDRGPESSLRREFTEIVHGKDVSSIKSFWQRQLFSGRDSPPPELDSDRAVLDHVARSPGGIGYIGLDTPLGPGVKVLRIE